MVWLFQDIRFGIRTILKDRGFFLTAVFALALGIGSTTAIFSVIDNVLLNPFPYTASERIFAIEIRDRAGRGSQGRQWFTVPEFLDYQQKNRVFDQSIGVLEETVLMDRSGVPEPFDADMVTGNTFQFLGVRPLLGRAILPSDAQPGAPPVFVLSYKMWVKKFGLDPGIVGKSYVLNGKPSTLIGIMPSRFAFWGGDLWMPASLDRAEPGAMSQMFVLYGHLKPGLDPKAAAGDVATLARQLSTIYPRNYPKQFDVRLESLGHIAVGRFENTLFTLLAAVGFLLLIACANVANLLLAKATAREKELALRLALGATRFRIVRQLMTESVLLALAGAAAGCLFAYGFLKGLVVMLPVFTFPDEAVISLNTGVLVATVAVAIITAILFGLAPALMAARRDLHQPMKAASRGNSGFRRGRLRNALIVGEVALSLALLTGSGLLMRSFFRERGIDLGIRPDHLLTAGINLPGKQYPTTDAQARFVRALLPKFESIPGVVSAAASLEAPPTGGISTGFNVMGATHAEAWKGYMAPCSHQYFQTVGVRLLSGRWLTEQDESGKRKVAVINRSMAAKFFGRSNPIGKQIELIALKSAPEPLASPWFEIAGVVSDVKNEGARRDVAPEAYIPYTVAGYGQYIIYVHTYGDPAAFGTALTKEILSLDRGVIPQQIETMDEILEVNQYARPRFALILFSVFAAIGLALVSVGVYSVISYAVTQQRHEIGIRMALGAGARDVGVLVLMSALRLICMGLAIGELLGLLLLRFLASQIWGVSWFDPLTQGGGLLILTLAGLAAAYVPSARAMRVDPAVSLREE